MTSPPPVQQEFKAAIDWRAIARKHFDEALRVERDGFDKPDAVNHFLTELDRAYPTELKYINAKDRDENLRFKYEGQARVYAFLKQNPEYIPDCSVNILLGLKHHPNQMLVDFLHLFADKKPKAFSRTGLAVAIGAPELQDYVKIILRSNPLAMQRSDEGAPANTLAADVFKRIIWAQDNSARDVYRQGSLAAIREFAPEAITAKSFSDFVISLQSKFKDNDAASDQLNSCLQIIAADILPNRKDLTAIWNSSSVPQAWKTRVECLHAKAVFGDLSDITQIVSPPLAGGGLTRPHILVVPPQGRPRPVQGG